MEKKELNEANVVITFRRFLQLVELRDRLHQTLHELDLQLDQLAELYGDRRERAA